MTQTAGTGATSGTTTTSHASNEALDAAGRGVVERRLARHGVAAALAVGTPVVAGAWLVAGTAGAVSAAVGVGCVLVLFAVSAAALAWAAPRGRRAVGRAVAYGAGLRLIGYAAALTLLAADDAVLHEASLAVGIITTFVGTLAVEMRTLVRSPEALWIDARSAAPRGTNTEDTGPVRTGAKP